MKPTTLNQITVNFNGNSTSNETIEMVWTSDLIESELNDILTDKNIQEAILEKQFLKSDFTLEEIENILGLYGEINDENDEIISVTWMKFNEDKQIILD